MSDFPLELENTEDIVGKIVRASTLESNGEIEQAIAIYEEVVELDPNGNYGNVAREALANLQPTDLADSSNSTAEVNSNTSWWKSLSLTVKAPILAIAITTLPMIAVGSTTYYVARQTVTQETGSTSRIPQKLGLTIAVSTALATTVTAISAYILALKLVAPILLAVGTVDRLGKGEFDARLHIDGEDELADLSKHINKMAGQIEDLLYTQEAEAKRQRQEKEKLQEGVMGLLLDVEGAKKGDLTVRAEMTDGAIGSIADAFNSTLQKLQGLLQEVRGVSTDVGQLSLAGEGSVKQLSESALTQAQEINFTLESIDEINQSIETVANYAQEAAQIARHGSIQAKEGDMAMDATVNSIEKIRTTVANTAKKVKQLAESSQEIAQIVEIISGISEKTNLLAFNASVEAARAGEHGEGFRIVAEEVRRLADRTTEATKDIQQLVTTIQQDTSSVLEGMETSTTEVVNGSELVKMTKANLRSLAETSQRIDEYLKSISTNTIDQTNTSRQVNEKINGIALVAKTTSSEAQTVVQSLRTLVEEAENLQSSVSQFKL